jgi:hypothetical protein
LYRGNPLAERSRACCGIELAGKTSNTRTSQKDSENDTATPANPEQVLLIRIALAAVKVLYVNVARFSKTHKVGGQAAGSRGEQLYSARRHRLP